MNVLMIAVDTLRADHLGCYGYHRDTSPRIDTFASTAAVFDTAFAAAVPTHPSFTTILTGQYPGTHGVVSQGGAPVPRGLPWLPSVFQRNGYTTCAIDNLADWRHGFGRSYEFYIDPTSRRNLAINADNRQINSRAVPWLKAHHGEPFFMMVHYWDPHTPYLPPRAHRNLFGKDLPDPDPPFDWSDFDRHPLGKTWRETWFNKLGPQAANPEYIVALYDGEIRHCDEGIGQLLGTLDEMGIADETLVVLVSDHGELMYKHGIYFDHHGLYDGNIHVPWILRHPSIQSRRVGGLAANVDFAPTILGLCGLPVPEEMEGLDWSGHLLGKGEAPRRDFVVSAECTWQMKWGLRTRDRKFILAREPDFYGTPMRELYDLNEDPGEFRNLADEQPEKVAAMEAQLEDWIAGMMAKHGKNQDPLVAHGITLGKRWQNPEAASEF
jgi:arylsulfatase A-like enzyme